MHNWRYQSKDILDSFGGQCVSAINNVNIYSVSTVSEPKNNCMIFVTSDKWKEEYKEKLGSVNNSFIIIEKAIMDNMGLILENNHVVLVENSRLYFAKALGEIVKSRKTNRQYKVLNNFVIMGENVKIGNGCTFEPFTFIDHDVIIKNNVTIKTGAKIRQYTKLGNNVVIGENSVIGAQGFGIEKDLDGRPIRIPHVGGVCIEDNVEVGALTSIVAGTIVPTHIAQNCFIDDLNHIAHNCIIDEGTLTTGCVQLGGSAHIGKNGYIAPNATIRTGVSLGNDSFVGQASSVQKDFGDNINLVGNPARTFNKK